MQSTFSGGTLKRVAFALTFAALGAVLALTFFQQGQEPQSDAFDPDHSRVFNGFQQSTSVVLGNKGVSSVEPDSECKRLEKLTWRCYRRWAPVGHPDQAQIIQADVNVYDDRVVVGEIERIPDPPRQ
ncbi:MAG TPA: hypothetical protein VFK41_08950 [Nocardioidaceae bacterium]|nr:hypothetical protein [Nocardioidaceae bacterium]